MKMFWLTVQIIGSAVVAYDGWQSYPRLGTIGLLWTALGLSIFLPAPKVWRWRAIQASIAAMCLYLAWIALVEKQGPGMVFAALFCAFFMPIAITVACAMIYELFRYTLPNAVRRLLGLPGGSRLADVDQPQGQDRSFGGRSGGHVLEDLGSLRVRQDRG